MSGYLCLAVIRKLVRLQAFVSLGGIPDWISRGVRASVCLPRRRRVVGLRPGFRDYVSVGDGMVRRQCFSRAKVSDTTKISRSRQRSGRTTRKRDGERAPAASSRAAATKKAKLEALLARARGATLAQLHKELGWQPHTVRAAISGLRKAGHTIDLEERNGRKAYRLAACSDSTKHVLWISPESRCRGAGSDAGSGLACDLAGATRVVAPNRRCWPG